MTKEDIIRMAQEADDYADLKLGKGEFHPDWHEVRDESFAALVASAEREACIKACDQVTADLKNYASAFEGVTAETKFVRNIGAIVGEPFIEAIRARGLE